MPCLTTESSACSHPSTFYKCRINVALELKIVRLPSRHPDELYKNGIQRSSFLPAIDLLKAHFDVTDLDSGTGPSFTITITIACLLLISLPGFNTLDYRRVPRALSHAYFSPLDSATRSAIDAQFTTLTRGIPIQEGKTIRIWGRNLTVPRSAGHIAQFSFAELCGRPLGAADYLGLAQRFRTLFVTDVPRMGLSEKDKVSFTKTFPPHLLIRAFWFIGTAIHHVYRRVL